MRNYQYQTILCSYITTEFSVNKLCTEFLFDLFTVKIYLGSESFTRWLV